MQTIMVWLLVSMSYSNHNYGTATVIGHFSTQQMCQHVEKNLPLKSYVDTRCIQAEIVK